MKAKHYYNVTQESCNSDSRITLNHEPMKKSDAYEACEILRRSYQFFGYTVSTEGRGFIVSDAISWLYRFYITEIVIESTGEVVEA